MRRCRGVGGIKAAAVAQQEEEEEEAEEDIRQVMSATASVWPLRSSGDEHGPRMDQTVVLSAILLAFFLYFNTLKADFAYDDRSVHLLLLLFLLSISFFYLVGTRRDSPHDCLFQHWLFFHGNST